MLGHGGADLSQNGVRKCAKSDAARTECLAPAAGRPGKSTRPLRGEEILAGRRRGPSKSVRIRRDPTRRGVVLNRGGARRSALSAGVVTNAPASGVSVALKSHRNHSSDEIGKLRKKANCPYVLDLPARRAAFHAANAGHRGRRRGCDGRAAGFPPEFPLDARRQMSRARRGSPPRNKISDLSRYLPMRLVVDNRPIARGAPSPWPRVWPARISHRPWRCKNWSRLASRGRTLRVRKPWERWRDRGGRA